MRNLFRVAVFISDRGSNLSALIDGAKDYSIVKVLSNKPTAPGLEFARTAGIDTWAMDRENFASLSALKKAIHSELSKVKPDLVALAGFMLVVQPELISEFAGRIVNIHPSLLPKFPGLDTHARALGAGETQHGCSVHFVDQGVDTGPVIAQARLEIEPDEREDNLAARVLLLEHKLYPWVVNAVARGEISLAKSRVQYSDQIKKEARQNGFIIPQEN